MPKLDARTMASLTGSTGGRAADPTLRARMPKLSPGLPSREDGFPLGGNAVPQRVRRGSVRLPPLDYTCPVPSVRNGQLDSSVLRSLPNGGGAWARMSLLGDLLSDAMFGVRTVANTYYLRRSREF